MTAMSTDHHSSMFAGMLSNPVAEKDAAFVLRRKTLALVVTLTWAAAGLMASMVASDQDLDSLALWSTPAPGGRALLFALTGAALVLQAVVVPLMASTTIAAERERGTWDTLVLTALSPAYIAGGKVLGQLLVAAVPLLVISPALAAAAFFGDVGALELAACLLALFAHAAAQASVGVWASATSTSTRTSVPRGLAFSAALIGVPVVLPALPLLAVAEGSDAPFVVVPGFAGATMAFLLALAVGLVGARSAVGPRAMPRARARFLVSTSIFLGAPLLLGAVRLFTPLPPFVDMQAAQGYAIAFPHLVAFLWGLAVVVEVAAAQRPTAALVGDAPTPWMATARILALAAVGLVVSAVVFAWGIGGIAFRYPVDTCQACLVRFAPGELLGLALLAAGALWVFLAGVAGTTLIVGRLLARPAGRVGATLVMGAVVLAIPYLGWAVTEALGLPRWQPLLALAPWSMVGSLDDKLAIFTPFFESDGGAPEWVIGGALWAVILVVGLWAGRPAKPLPGR